MLSRTFNQKGQFFLNGPLKCPWIYQIGHTKWSCLIKLAILIWLTTLLIMPTKLHIYLTYTYLHPTYLLTKICPTLPTYLPTIYLPIYLTIYLSIYMFIYRHTYICLPIIYLPIYLSIYMPIYILNK